MLEPGNHFMTINAGEMKRHFIIHVPPGYDRHRPAAVVMMFHGGGGTGTAAMRETHWSDKSDQCGFLAVFPEASRPDPSNPADFRNNPQIWNDGSARFGKEVDDVEFIKTLIEYLSVHYNIDSRRIYATGFSNGASMSYRLGMELSGKIAAIAPVAGALWTEDPKPDRPIPLLYITGTKDPLNPINGGVPRLAIGGRGLGGKPKPPVEKQINIWVRMLGCPDLPDVVSMNGGITRKSYGPCKAGTEVVYYTIEGMGHTWPGGFSILPEEWVGKTTDKMKANDVIWDFFKKHPMP